MSHFIEHRKKERVPKKKIIVIYHSNCTDGFSGAWAAWKKLGKKADYFPWIHQKTHLPPFKNKEIYFIDICPRAEELKRLAAANKRVVVIDHHISAKRDGVFADEYVYALNHSGATLAWSYFYPNKPTPKFLKYVEDNDLWLKKMPHAREVYAYLDLFEFDFAFWNKFARDFEKPKIVKNYLEKGKLLLKHEDKLIEDIISKTAIPVKFFGIRTLAVNSPVFASGIGYKLYSKNPPMGIIWYERDGQTRVSLRSNGKINVAKFAEKFGGGGHKSSAGFAIPVGKKMPWTRIK